MWSYKRGILNSMGIPTAQQSIQIPRRYTSIQNTEEAMYPNIATYYIRSCSLYDTFGIHSKGASAKPFLQDMAKTNTTQITNYV